jgi:hypothetical protein
MLPPINCSSPPAAACTAAAVAAAASLTPPPECPADILPPLAPNVSDCRPVLAACVRSLCPGATAQSAIIIRLAAADASAADFPTPAACAAAAAAAPSGCAERAGCCASAAGCVPCVRVGPAGRIAVEPAAPEGSFALQVTLSLAPLAGANGAPPPPLTVTEITLQVCERLHLFAPCHILVERGVIIL